MEKIEMNEHIGIGVDQFVEENYRLALDVANKSKKKYPREEFEDLLQLALIGLVKAYQGYDPKKFSTKFSTYGVPKMIGEIIRYMRDHGSAIRFPREYKQIWKKVTKMDIEEEPYEVIAEKIGHDVEKVSEAMLYLDKQQATSLDKPINGDDPNDDLTMLDRVHFKTDETELYISEFMDTLSERDQLILRLYVEGMKQREIGAIVGVSQVQVSRVVKRIGLDFQEHIKVS